MATPAKKKAAAKKAVVKSATPAAKRSVAPAKKAAVVKKAAAKKAAPAPAKKAAPAVNAAPAKKAPAKKAARPVDMKFLEAQRKILIDERARLLRQSESLRAEADSLTADRELGDTQFDDESGEGDTMAVERERDLVLSAQALAMIVEIDHALTKIDDRTYGICEISGQPIPKERLKAIPWARERVEYKVGGFVR